MSTDVVVVGVVGITDVSALGNIHMLILQDCDGITDVSALGSVHTLILESCENITDVSALGNVNTLNIKRCVNISKEQLIELKKTVKNLKY